MVVISDIMFVFCVLICINAVANCACRSSWCIELLAAPVSTVGTFTGGVAAGGDQTGGAGGAANGGTKNGGTVGGKNGGTVGVSKGTSGHTNAASSGPEGHITIGVAKGASTGGGHRGVGAAKGTANGTGLGTGTICGGLALPFIMVVHVRSSPASWSMLLTSEAGPAAISLYVSPTLTRRSVF